MVAPELFGVALIAEGRCRARIYSKKNLPVVFLPCGNLTTVGEFCKRHKKAQAQGLWDPPLHASLPAEKLEEARRDVAKWRFQTAASVVPSAKAKRGGRGLNPGACPSTEPRVAKDDASLLVDPSSVGTATGICTDFMNLSSTGAKGVRVASSSASRNLRAERLPAGRDVPSLLDDRAMGSQSSDRRARIVTGFGAERVEDVAADEARRIAASAKRGDLRREEGTRGRMRDFANQDLDRSAGGAWHLGR